MKDYGTLTLLFQDSVRTQHICRRMCLTLCSGRWSRSAKSSYEGVSARTTNSESCLYSREFAVLTSSLFSLVLSSLTQAISSRAGATIYFARHCIASLPRQRRRSATPKELRLFVSRLPSFATRTSTPRSLACRTARDLITWRSMLPSRLRSTLLVD